MKNGALAELAAVAVRERDELLLALSADIEDTKTQEALAKWRGGKSDGWLPPGETPAPLGRLRPRKGYSFFEVTAADARQAALESPAAAYVLERIERLESARKTLIAEAERAFSESKNTPSTLPKHAAATQAIVGLLGSKYLDAGKPPKRKAAGKKRKRGPYKTDNDPEADGKLWQDWQAAKRSGVGTIAGFCRRRGLDEGEVRAAHDRHRHNKG